MKTYALLGYPLSHSFSARYFSDKFKNNHIDAQYINLEIQDISGIRKEIFEKGYSGLNVTIPHKKAIIPFLDELSEDTSSIGAVNCIQVVDNRLIGHNTDARGFTDSVDKLIPDNLKTALIFGNGGSAKAVGFALSKLDIEYRIVSRSGSLNYHNLKHSDLSDAELLINCTPLGMFPNLDSYPSIPFDAVTGEHFAFDLVYNPEETEFMKRVKAKGGKVMNGLKMLELQAEASWAIWNS